MCGHLPPALRDCLSQIARIPDDTRILPDWQNRYAPARRRRSEIREICSIALWVYFSRWVALETRMTGTPGNHLGVDFREVPTVKQIAQQATRAFPGKAISEVRVRRLLWELEDLGYISSHGQIREQKQGTWVAKPQVLSFTKQFFVQLGGNKLWKRVLKAGSTKLRQITRRLLHHAPDLFRKHSSAEMTSRRIQHYIAAGRPVSTRELYRINGHDPPEEWRRLLFPHLTPAS